MNIKKQTSCIKCGSNFNVKYLSFFGSEIFGIFPDSKISVGNSVAFALRHREKFHLPVSWIPIFDYDDGYVAYFDYSSLNDEGEPEVILATYDGNAYTIVEHISEDFGDFLLKVVQE